MAKISKIRVDRLNDEDQRIADELRERGNNRQANDIEARIARRIERYENQN